MKKYLVFLLLSCVFSITAQNIIKNGNFSQLSKSEKSFGWRLSWAKPPGIWKVEQGSYVTKPGALLIDNKPGQDTIVVQVVKLKPDTLYRFSCWMKGENIQSAKKNGGARFYLQDKGKIIRDGSPTGLFKRAIGSFKWGKIEFNFNSNLFKSGVATIYLSLRRASGKVWYDDVIIEEVKKKKTENKLSGKLFPVDFQSNTYNVCEGLPGMLLLDVKCGAVAKKNGLKLRLDLPENVKLIGSSPWLSVRLSKNGNWLPTADKKVKTTVIRNGVKYSRYTVDINAKITRRAKSDSYAWGNFDRLFIAAKPGSAGKSGMAYWTLISGKQSSQEKRFIITSLPKIKLPKNKSLFGMMICYLWTQTSPFEEVSNAYMKYWTSLSKNPKTLQLFQWHKRSLAIRQRIEKNFKVSYMLGSNFGTPRFNYTDMTRRLSKGELINEFPPLINYKGEKVFRSIAPYYLIEDPKGLFWGKYFVEEIKQAIAHQDKIDMIIFDCEPGAKDHGFSLENRKRFSKFAKLQNVPSIAKIRSKYSTKWFDFRVVQHSKIIRKFCQTIHKYFSGLKVVLCSDPIHAGDSPLAQWCGVDVRLSDADVDLFMNMPYYSGIEYYNDLRFNEKILKKSNFPLIDPSENMEQFYKRYTPQSVKQNIVATAALGGAGIGFWPSDAFDGRYLHSIASAFSLVSAGEKYYQNPECSDKLKSTAVNVLKRTFVESGNKLVVELPDFASSVKILLHHKNDEYLITVINYNLHNDCILKLAIPSIAKGQYLVQDVETEYFIDDSKSSKNIKDGFLAKVKAGDVALFKIMRKNSQPVSSKIINSSVLQKELDEFKAKLAAENQFKSMKKDNSSIKWSALPDSDGMPKLKLQNGSNSIYISPPKSATIVGWKKSSGNEDYLLFKSRGFLGELVFYDETQRKTPYDFKLEKIDIINGCPSVQLIYMVPSYEGANAKLNPLEGMIVTKTITLQKDGSVKSAFKFTNKNPHHQTMRFGFRVKNYPRLGGRLAGSNSLSAISRVEYQTTKGKNIIKTGSNPANWLIDTTLPRPKLISKNAKVTNWKNSPVIAYAGTGNLQDTMIFESDKTFSVGFLIWWSMTNYTVEMLSKEIELPYGESTIFSYSIK